MRKSTAQALLSIPVAVLFLLPNLAAAYSYVQVPIYTSGYFDFLTQRNILTSVYNQSSNAGLGYAFFEGNPIGTSTRGFTSSCGSSPATCAPSGYSAQPSDTLDMFWQSGYGTPAPDGPYWAGFWTYPTDFGEPTLQYVTVFYKLNGQWFSGNSPVASSTINWNQIAFPVIFSSSSQAIATGSPLWNSLSVASSSVRCDSGNIFSDGLCAALSYLFVPEPTILNSYVQLFATSTPGGFFSRFPASYAVGLSNAWSNLSASSTANAALLAFDFPGISTTTPGFGTFIPARVELLSTTTISTYYPDNIRLAMLFLITCGLWLGLATDMFFSVRNKMHRV